MLPKFISYIQLRCTVLVFEVTPMQVVALVVSVCVPEPEYLAMFPHLTLIGVSTRLSVITRAFTVSLNTALAELIPVPLPN